MCKLLPESAHVHDSRVSEHAGQGDSRQKRVDGLLASVGELGSPAARRARGHRSACEQGNLAWSQALRCNRPPISWIYVSVLGPPCSGANPCARPRRSWGHQPPSRLLPLRLRTGGSTSSAACRPCHSGAQIRSGWMQMEEEEPCPSGWSGTFRTMV